jgi:hypothetical protein
VGKISKRIQVHHLCRNTLCCNPGHLELVTPEEHLVRHAMDQHGRIALDPVVRFMDFIELSPDGCWNWTGALNKDGYGKFTSGNRPNRITHGAHRFSYCLFVNPIPSSLLLLHKCKNRFCVNPDHLEPSTKKELLRLSPRMVMFSNVLKTHCPQGHPLSGSNLHIDRRGCRRCRECNQD